MPIIIPSTEKRVGKILIFPGQFILYMKNGVFSWYGMSYIFLVGMFFWYVFSILKLQNFSIWKFPPHLDPLGRLRGPVRLTRLGAPAGPGGLKNSKFFFKIPKNFPQKTRSPIVAGTARMSCRARIALISGTPWEARLPRRALKARGLGDCLANSEKNQKFWKFIWFFGEKITPKIWSNKWCNWSIMIHWCPDNWAPWNFGQLGTTEFFWTIGHQSVSGILF